ncbi:MAG: HAD-IIIA family hydrolase [Bacteroidia bacterium]|nr:HAD-IIIA family hydrolase [Bacteroidia bacterium]
MKQNFKESLHSITCFVFDVDGVLTDGSLMVMQGDQIRKMNIRDGFALQAAVNSGYKVIIITGGNSESVRIRLEQLGIKEIHSGIRDKKEKLLELMEENNLSPEQIIYMGDDLPDYDAMQIAGIRTCPSDAAPEIKAICNYISPVSGGGGCARDIIEQVMRLQNNWHTHS